MHFGRPVAPQGSDGSYSQRPGIGEVLHTRGDPPDSARGGEFLQSFHGSTHRATADAIHRIGVTPTANLEGANT